MTQETLVENTNMDTTTIKTTAVIYICGQRETGKSYLFGKLGDSMPRLVIYDAATYQHGARGTLVKTAEELDTWLAANSTGTAVCQPRSGNAETFNEFCGVILKHGNLMLAVEEIGNYMDSFSCPENADVIIRTGRNMGIGLMGINQRPSRIWLNYIALVDHWFIFRTQLQDDATFIGKYIGKEREKTLKELPDRNFYYMDKRMRVTRCNPVK